MGGFLCVMPTHATSLSGGIWLGRGHEVMAPMLLIKERRVHDATR